MRIDRILIVACFAVALGCAAPAAGSAAGPSGPIAALQARLAGLGYAPGPIDGVMSAKTRQAMLAYRRATGRPIAAGPEGDPTVAAQTALRALGFLSGPADGAVGPQTRDAIIRFQAANRLPVDPRVSDQLLAELDRTAAAATGGAPSPGSRSGATTMPATPAITGREPLPPGLTPPADPPSAEALDLRTAANYKADRKQGGSNAA